MDAEDSFSIPPNLFNEDRPFISTDISFREKNENNSIKILLKIPPFQNGKHGISINLITREVKVYSH